MPWTRARKGAFHIEDPVKASACRLIAASRFR